MTQYMSMEHNSSKNQYIITMDIQERKKKIDINVDNKNFKNLKTVCEAIC